MPIKSGHQFIWNSASWFIAPLFMVEVYNIILRRIVKRHFLAEWIEWLQLFIFIMLSIVAEHIVKIGIREDWWLVLIRFWAYLPFFQLGVVFKQHLDDIKNCSAVFYFGGIAIAYILINCIYGRTSVYGLEEVQIALLQNGYILQLDY